MSLKQQSHAIQEAFAIINRTFLPCPLCRKHPTVRWSQCTDGDIQIGCRCFGKGLWTQIFSPWEGDPGVLEYDGSWEPHYTVFEDHTELRQHYLQKAAAYWNQVGQFSQPITGNTKKQLFQVWVKGREKGWCKGAVEADSFEKACDIILKDDPDYDPEKKTYWTCRLFPTANEVPKNFG